MFAVPDALAAFYLVCFFIGLIFVIVSALMGLGEHIVHLPGFSHHVHVGHVSAHTGRGTGGKSGGRAMIRAGRGKVSVHRADTPGQAGDSSTTVTTSVTASPLNLMTLMAFLTWFGAAGYILHAFYGVFAPLTILIALVAGGVAGWLVFLFLIKVLLPGTVGVRIDDQRIVGSLARVTIPIPEQNLGEVVYSLGGSRHSEGARSVDGGPIPRDTDVVIVRYKNGIAYVQPWQAFIDGGGANQEVWRSFLEGDEDDLSR